MVTNALGMAIEGRNPTADETVIHSALGMGTPVEFENRHQHKPAA